MNRRMRYVSLALLLGALALAGCGGTAVVGPSGVALPGPPVRAAVPSLATDIRLTKHVPCSRTGPPVGAATVARFHAVTALMCGYGTRRDQNGISWNIEIRKVATTGVAAVQRYFEQLSVTTPADGTCAAYSDGISAPAFVDGRGRWLVPETPTDACGHVLDGRDYVRRALRIHWRVVAVNRVSRTTFG